MVKGAARVDAVRGDATPNGREWARALLQQGQCHILVAAFLLPSPCMDPLLGRIRSRINGKLLPDVDCVATWYRAGRGQRCDACDKRILATDLGLDCDLPDGSTARFHARCYVLWHSLVAM
jgi:hypothetical protein